MKQKQVRLSMKLLWKLYLNWTDKVKDKDADISWNVSVQKFLNFVESEMKSPNKGI